MSTANSILSFDEFVDLLRFRLGAADVLKPHEGHELKELWKPDEAEVIPDNWWWEAFDELDAQRHLDRASSAKKMGVGNVHARLSADGRLYLGLETET